MNHIISILFIPLYILGCTETDFKGDGVKRIQPKIMKDTATESVESDYLPEEDKEPEAEIFCSTNNLTVDSGSSQSIMIKWNYESSSEPTFKVETDEGTISNQQNQNGTLQVEYTAPTTDSGNSEKSIVATIEADGYKKSAICKVTVEKPIEIPVEQTIMCSTQNTIVDPGGKVRLKWQYESNGQSEVGISDGAKDVNIIELTKNIMIVEYTAPNPVTQKFTKRIVGNITTNNSKRSATCEIVVRATPPVEPDISCITNNLIVDPDSSHIIKWQFRSAPQPIFKLRSMLPIGESGSINMKEVKVFAEDKVKVSGELITTYQAPKDVSLQHDEIIEATFQSGELKKSATCKLTVKASPPKETPVEQSINCSTDNLSVDPGGSVTLKWQYFSNGKPTLKVNNDTKQLENSGALKYLEQNEEFITLEYTAPNSVANQFTKTIVAEIETNNSKRSAACKINVMADGYFNRVGFITVVNSIDNRLHKINFNPMSGSILIDKPSVPCGSLFRKEDCLSSSNENRCEWDPGHSQSEILGQPATAPMCIPVQNSMGTTKKTMEVIKKTVEKGEVNEILKLLNKAVVTDSKCFWLLDDKKKYMLQLFDDMNIKLVISGDKLCLDSTFSQNAWSIIDDFVRNSQ